MIYIYQVMDKDFILLDGSQKAALAFEIVSELTPSGVIVRYLGNGNLCHYLYTVYEFLDQLDFIDEEQTLAQVLKMQEKNAAPVFDPFQEFNNLPGRCIIVDGDRLVGFYNIHQLPENKRKDSGSRNTSQEEKVFTHSLKADFPERVVLGQTISLLVSLAKTKKAEGISVSAPAGSIVDVVVQVQQGFDLECPCDGQLAVTDEEETLPIQFHIKATKIGPGRIRILCFQGGQPLGATTLAPTVVEVSEPGEEKRISPTDSDLALITFDQPDLSLIIFESINQGFPEISFRLSARDPNLGLNLKPFGAVRLRTDPLRYFTDFFTDIERLPLRNAEERAIAVQIMALKGSRLFHDLLPEELRQQLWSMQDRIQTVQVLSEEPWIPWEFLKLQGRDPMGRVEEGPFFCEKFIMTRWFPGIGRRPVMHLKQIAIVVPGDTGLAYSQYERDYLLSLSDGRHIEQIPANYLDVIRALSSGKYDGWHFTGHGVFTTPDPNRSTIFFERGQQLSAEEICGCVGNCGQAQPLVFLNACQVGREALSLTGVGGWAKNFIDAGVAGFIGPLWSVNDNAACKFTQVFYDRLLSGDTIGLSVQKARNSIRSLDELTWLAYSVFADPLARVI